jgi:hypothetical protein
MNAPQLLNRAQAYGLGARVWFIPSDLNSSLLTKIDWYTGFRISKSNQIKSSTLPDELREILKSHEFTITEKPLNPALPNLLSVKSTLPTEVLVCVPRVGSGKEWIRQLLQCWNGLHKPDARIFLPHDVDFADIKDLLISEDGNKLSVVPTTPGITGANLHG